MTSKHPLDHKPYKKLNIREMTEEDLANFTVIVEGLEGVGDEGFAVEAEEGLLFIGGVVLSNHSGKVGDLWMIPTELKYKYKREMYIYAMKIISYILQKFELDRLQAYVRSDSQIDQDFIERLHFTEKNLMRKWGPDGKDWYMYARLN